jgi:hypothetical protein
MNPKAIRPIFWAMASFFTLVLACRPTRVIYVEKEPQTKVVVVKEQPKVIVVKGPKNSVMPGPAQRNQADEAALREKERLERKVGYGLERKD